MTTLLFLIAIVAGPIVLLTRVALFGLQRPTEAQREQRRVEAEWKRRHAAEWLAEHRVIGWRAWWWKTFK